MPVADGRMRRAQEAAFAEESTTTSDRRISPTLGFGGGSSIEFSLRPRTRPGVGYLRHRSTSVPGMDRSWRRCSLRGSR